MRGFSQEHAYTHTYRTSEREREGVQVLIRPSRPARAAISFFPLLQHLTSLINSLFSPLAALGGAAHLSLLTRRSPTNTQDSQSAAPATPSARGMRATNIHTCDYTTAQRQLFRTATLWC